MTARLRHAFRTIRPRPIVLTALLCAIVALVVLLATQLDRARDAREETAALSTDRATVERFASRASMAQYEALQAYVSAGQLDPGALLDFLVLTEQIELFFEARRTSQDLSEARIARINLSNLDDARIAVRDLAARAEPEDGPSFLGDNVNVGNRFFNGLQAWLVVNKRQIDAAHAREESSEMAAIVGASALVALLLAVAVGATRRLVTARQSRMRDLQELAVTDPLTGLANRRGLDAHLEGRLAGLGDTDSLSVALIDLDDFKRVNDDHGHEAGDGVLAECSRRLGALLESGEFAARYGGDEFLVVMPRDAGPAARRVGEITDALSREEHSGVGLVSASAGLATHAEPDDARALIKRADVALYRAKTARPTEGEGQLPSVLTDDAVEARATLGALERLARRIDSFDAGSVGHSERVARLARRLALESGWDWTAAERLAEAAAIHDIGKIALPREVLTRPGPLDAEEHRHVRLHPEIGARLAADVLDAEQRAWIRHHHETWDGRGYPSRLAGDAIPEGARLLAIADSWDAMRCSRAYAAALDLDAALIECRAHRDTQFWARGVDLLERVITGGGLDDEADDHPAPPPEGPRADPLEASVSRSPRESS